LSLTLSVALATLVVMGGILAGPALVDCARDGEHMGACLRDRVAGTGLVAPDERQLRPPAATAEAPVPDAARPAGWIEANATEYAPASPATALLAAPTGVLDVSGAATVQMPAPTGVALAAPQGEMTALAGAPAVDRPAVALIAPGETLAATGNVSAEPARPVAAALAAPVGQLAAGMAVPTPPAASAASWLAPRAALIEARGGEPAVTAVEASVAPAAPLATGTVLATRSSAPPEMPPAAAQLEASATAPVPAPELPAPVIRYDPQFPNVLVLPAPSSGEASSIRRLELN